MIRKKFTWRNGEIETLPVPKRACKKKPPRRKIPIKKLLIIVLISTIILASCSLPPSGQTQKETHFSWHEGQLRAIDPPDSSAPDSDILAVFSYQRQNSLYIRIDLLKKLDPAASLQINVAEGTSALSGHEESKLTFTYQAGKKIETYNDPLPGFTEISLLSSGEDWVSFHIDGLKQIPTLLINVSTIKDKIILDETGWIDMQQMVPPVPLLLAFHNSLQANTPAQALRRWDGAHTGPQGSRHGLRYLLESAAAYQVPITLLDIKQPSTLAALDSLPGMELITNLVNRNIVFIPEPVAGETDAQGQTLTQSRFSGLKNGLIPTNAIYGTASKVFPGHDVYYYATQANSAIVYASPGYRLIPVHSGSQSDLINKEGLTSNALQLLAGLGADPAATGLAVFGGDFSASFWGDPVAAAKSMAYIADHPWIHPVKYSELYQLPAQPVSSFESSCSNLLCRFEPDQIYPQDAYRLWQSRVYPQLSNLPPNPVTDSAWQLYSRITDPPLDPNLAILQWQYRSTLDMLIAASGWAGSPYTMQTCNDQEPRSFCILANESILAILSLDSAGLVMLFTRQNGSVHQWIAPYSQYMVGLSDPTAWHAADANPDPALIEGGFIPQEEAKQFAADTTHSSISFASVEKTIEYALSGDSLTVTISTSAPDEFKVPVLGILSGTGAEFLIQSISSFGEPQINRLKIDISGSTFSEIFSFMDSYYLLKEPEDPNLAYPPGHYLPYPFSFLSIQSDVTFTTTFTVDPGH